MIMEMLKFMNPKIKYAETWINYLPEGVRVVFISHRA